MLQNQYSILRPTRRRRKLGGARAIDVLLPKLPSPFASVDRNLSFNPSLSTSIRVLVFIHFFFFHAFVLRLIYRVLYPFSFACKVISFAKKHTRCGCNGFGVFSGKPLPHFHPTPPPLGWPRISIAIVANVRLWPTGWFGTKKGEACKVCV